jgi:uncharacterized repeat protein (TIGR01451 family)
VRVAQVAGICFVSLFVLTLCPAEELKVLRGHTSFAKETGQPTGTLAPSQKLRLAIGLPLHNQQALTDLLEQIYSPQSPQYHQYLTPEQFTRQFGPTELEYQAVIEFARTNGLTVEGTYPNRRLVDVSGTVADIQRALHVNMGLYQHPLESRTFYAPDREPSVPATLPVLHVSGLDNYLVPRPAGLRLGAPPAPAGSQPVPLAGSGPGGAYRGNDFRGAYARAVSLNGTGQMVGLLEFDGYYLSDVTSYWSQSSIKGVPIMNVTMDGFDGTPGNNNVEPALDIEVVSSMAPGLSQIIVYEAGPTGIGNDVLNRMANDNLAKQLSASWTFPIDLNTELIFEQFAAQGQTYFNSSGDLGAYTNSVPTPADDPFITIVGGTVLTTTGPGGAWVSETVWNRGGTGSSAAATGGGISSAYSIPTYQKPVNMTANKGSLTMRNLPDVAGVAEGVWVTYNNGSTESVGGTSCSSPLWAAFMALVNQQAASFGRPPVGFLNPAIYTIGLSSGYSTNFHDVTVGNNTNTTSPNLFFAEPGFDLCTGWGTPLGQNLISSLAPRIAARVITNSSATIVVQSCSAPNGAINPGETVTVNFALKNIGSVKATNAIAVLQADGNVLFPSDPQNYGVLTGGGAAATRAFTFTAFGNCGDAITPTLQIFDGPLFLGTVPFKFTLGVPATSFAENFDGVSAPALPAGWAASVTTNTVSLWVSSTNQHDSAPNAMFADEPPNRGIEDLLSPPISIVSSNAQLQFRNSYNTETDATIDSKSYDGGILEIQVGTNAFTDILAAGGSFAAGGYVRTISTDTNDDNPLAGRQVWGGNSGGFISTIVNLPASAAGQMIQLKWRFAVDTGNFYGGTGWYIDSVSIRDGATCCLSSADLELSQSVSPEPVAPGQNLTYSITVTNLGPDTAAGVTVTNALPPMVTFSSGSAGCLGTNGSVLCQAGTLPPGTGTNFVFSVLAQTADPITNLIQVLSPTPDPNLTNNTAMLVSTISTNSAPVFLSQPTNLTVFQGQTVSLQSIALGTQPVTYQWLFNGAPLMGQTQPVLALTNVQLSQTGAYSVIASNANGSITSAPPAQLTVLGSSNFQVDSINVTAGSNVSISAQSFAGRNYTLQFKNSLTDSNWTPILPAVPGTGQPVLLQDTNPIISPTRFYRVMSQ